MGWVRLDDAIFMNRKMVECSAPAKLLFIGGLTYSASALTDGVISKAALRTIAGAVDVPQKAVKDLVAQGLWHEVAGGWRIHDYHDYQPPAEEERRRREAHAERMRDWRHKKRDKSRDGPRDGPREGDVTVNVTPDVTPLCSPGDALPDPDPDPDPSSSSSVGNSRPPRRPVDDDDPEVDAEVERRYQASLAAGTRIPAPKAWKAKARANLLAEVAEQGRSVLRPPPATSQDPLDATAAAQRARAQRNDARARGEACEECDGTGFVLDDDVVAVECQACRPAAVGE